MTVKAHPSQITATRNPNKKKTTWRNDDEHYKVIVASIATVLYVLSPAIYLPVQRLDEARTGALWLRPIEAVSELDSDRGRSATVTV